MADVGGVPNDADLNLNLDLSAAVAPSSGDQGGFDVDEFVKAMEKARVPARNRKQSIETSLADPDSQFVKDGRDIGQKLNHPDQIGADSKALICQGDLAVLDNGVFAGGTPSIVKALLERINQIETGSDSLYRDYSEVELIGMDDVITFSAQRQSLQTTVLNLKATLLGIAEGMLKDGQFGKFGAFMVFKSHGRGRSKIGSN